MLPSTTGLPNSAISFKKGVTRPNASGDTITIVLPSVGKMPSISLSPANQIPALSMPPLALPSRAVPDIEVYDRTIQRFHEDADAGILPTQTHHRQLCSAVETYLKSPEGQSAPETWGSAVFRANLLIERWNLAGMAFAPIESAATLQSRHTAPNPQAVPGFTLAPQPSAVQWLPEAQAMRDLMLAWTALAQRGVAPVSELTVLKALMAVTASDRFSEAERTGLNALATQLVALWSAERKTDTAAQNQAGQTKVTLAPQVKRAADTHTAQGPAKVRKTGTSVEGPGPLTVTVPKMKTELAGEFRKLQGLLGITMALGDPKLRKTQIETLRRQFQETSTLALRDGNTAAYRHIEQRVSDWFREQYTAAGSSLPPRRLADPFNLLDGAPGTLIQLMHANNIGLARHTAPAEGGELLQAPPPTPRDEET